MAACAVAATGFFLRGGFEGGIPVSARFSAPGVGQQLPEGGDVKIRGVLVGRIHEIELADDGDAIVHLRLTETTVARDSHAEIRSKTVFGEKWVELIPPAGSEGPFLTAGDVIPDRRTTEPLELERALELGYDLLSAVPLEDLAATTRALAEGFGGHEDDARIAMSRGLVALRAVNSRSADLDLGLRQLRDFSAWLDQNDETLLSFMASLDSANRALVGAAPELRSNLQTVPAFFGRLAGFQGSIEDDLGRLVPRGATLGELVAARADRLEALVVNLEAFLTVWNSGLEQPCGNIYEDDLTCWQVYQPPGLRSRGLYGAGDAPDANQPGDPLFGDPDEAAFPDYLTVLSTRSAGVRESIRMVLNAPLEQR